MNAARVFRAIAAIAFSICTWSANAADPADGFHDADGDRAAGIDKRRADHVQYAAERDIRLEHLLGERCCRHHHHAHGDASGVGGGTGVGIVEVFAVA